MEPTRITILTPADAPQLEAFLRPRLTTSLFLLSNMRRAGLVDWGERYQGTYAAAWVDGHVQSVAGHFWNGILILQAPCFVREVVREALASSGRPLTGIIGPADQVASALAFLRTANLPVRVDFGEILYRLDLSSLAVPEALISGRLAWRKARAEDAALLAEWNADYSVEALGEQDTPDLRRAHRAGVGRTIAEGRTWILEDAGRPVSMCGFNAAIEEAVQVGPVWTPPELRRRGYGRSVVAAALMDAAREGVREAVLFTDVGNIPARKAYEAIGFRRIGSFRIVLLAHPTGVELR